MDSVRRTIMASMLLGGLSCGHSHAEQPAVVAPTAPNAAQEAPAAVAAPHEASDAGVQAQADAAARLPEPGSAVEHEPITHFMPDHFWIVSWARDAVIDGDLESLRRPLLSLADYTYDSVVPGPWMDGIGKLQAAARLTANADNLSVAASGVATMTRICGQCHEQQGHRLELFPVEVVTKTPKSDTLKARMNRHAWASERLWEGLMAPSDQVWQAGAAALAHAPVKAPKIGAFTPKDFAQSLARLRDLGLRASQATSPEERSNIYGLALATCAECHADTAIAGF